VSTVNNPLSKIKHVVVLMLENRSFDNVLGWLYDSKNEPPFDCAPRGQSFEGVSGKILTNPVPGGDAEVTECIDMVAPHPNPNEAFADVYRQMYNDEHPPDPSKPIPELSGPPSMQGFALNYASAINEYKKAHPDKKVTTTPEDIMRCYRPKSLPVINGLANAYAVCDHWFSSVPTETFPNRSFVHSGTSSGHVYNEWSTGEHKWDIGVEINHEKTIFNLLEEAGMNWGSTMVRACSPASPSCSISGFILTPASITRGTASFIWTGSTRTQRTGDCLATRSLSRVILTACCLGHRTTCIRLISRSRLTARRTCSTGSN
jgi:phospholipase C